MPAAAGLGSGDDTHDEVEGWLTPREGELLHRLARACTGRGTIVEIGSWKGKSTILLARGSAEGARSAVYAIDPHAETAEHHRAGAASTLDEFRANVRAAGVADLVREVVATSEDAVALVDGPIELLFIDGDHAYESVRRDWDLWVPRVVEGGMVALHDVRRELEGPRRIAREQLFGSRDFRGVAVVDSIAYGEKTSVSAAHAAYTSAVRLARDAASRLRLPEPVRAFGRRVLRYRPPR